MNAGPALVLSLAALGAAQASAAARADALDARLALRECVAAQRAAAIAACGHALDLGLGRERAAVAQRLLARGFALLERWDEALASYRQVLKLVPEDPDAALDVGATLLYSLGRAAEAEPYLRQALTGRPDDAVLHVHLATALNATGRHADALDEFKAALGLDVTVLDGRPAAQATYMATLRQALWP